MNWDQICSNTSKGEREVNFSHLDFCKTSKAWKHGWRQNLQRPCPILSSQSHSGQNTSDNLLGAFHILRQPKWGFIAMVSFCQFLPISFWSKYFLKLLFHPNPTHPREIVQNLTTENDPTLYFTDLLQLFSHYICYTHKVLNKLAKLGDAIASDLKLSLTHWPTHSQG